MSKPASLITTVVWGDWHVDVFLRVNVPTMLAAGNLPALVRQVDVVYTIYTTNRDRSRIVASPAFQAMAQLMPVHFMPLNADDIGAPTATHHRVWQWGIDEARKRDAHVILMPPDVVWSDGSLGHLGALVAAGKKAIFLNWHVRSVEDTFVPAFIAKFPCENQSIAVGARALVRLSLDHVHPMTGAYFRSSPNFPHHPEMIFWPVSNEGLLMRVLALVPFVFQPNAIELTPQRTVARYASADDLHFVVDSDDLYMVSLTEIGKDADWYRLNAPLDPIYLARWWIHFDSPANAPLAAANYRLHFAEPTPLLWRRRETEARLCVHRLSATRELTRIRDAARRLGCNRSADILDYALLAGLAPAIAGHAKPMIVLVPDDKALLPWAPTIAWLLHPRRRRELIDILRAHCIPHDALPADVASRRWQGQISAESGSRYDIAVTAHLQIGKASAFLAKAEAAGKHVVYAVSEALQTNPSERAGKRRLTWHVDQGVPDRVGEVLVQAAAAQAEPAVLNQLTDALRQRGIEARLIRTLMERLGWDMEAYRGFDHLPQRTRAVMKEGDPWHWHRHWLGSALPGQSRAKLAADLAFGSWQREEIEAEIKDGRVPPFVGNIAIAMNTATPWPTVAKTIERAAREDPFTGPLARMLGASAYRVGEGRAAAEQFHLSLHTSDNAALDLTTSQPAGQEIGAVHRVAADYYGFDYLQGSGVFLAVPTRGDERPQGYVVKGGRLVVQQPAFVGVRKWLLRHFPERWVLRLRDIVYRFVDKRRLVTNVPMPGTMSHRKMADLNKRLKTEIAHRR